MHKKKQFWGTANPRSVKAVEALPKRSIRKTNQWVTQHDAPMHEWTLAIGGIDQSCHE